MARIYTRTGDGGETSLFDGSRVSKSAARVDLYGGTDELNSVIGLALAALPEAQASNGAGAVPGLDLDPSLLRTLLLRVQSDLLEIGAILANPLRSRTDPTEAGEDSLYSVPELEGAIDRLEEDLPALKAFILPGGSPTAAALHLARTVCRRIERSAVALAEAEPVPASVIVYLNRLSDFCFVAARWANRAAGLDDVTWQTRS